MPVENKKAYVVAVDMGYGHQRAAYPLADLAEGGIINANIYPGIPKADEKRWQAGQGLYETISRLKNLPFVGERIFKMMDYFQRVENFYPARDLSKPTLQLQQIYKMIRSGWGRDLINRLNKNPLPLISTFFTPAYFAEEHGYKGDIYLVICDADCSRAWAPLHANKSRIKFLIPNRRVKERLELYGVRPSNIFITGFPLPKENIGGRDLKILRQSVAHRVSHLDPEGKYQKKFKNTLSEFLGKVFTNKKHDGKEPLTITFAVGGAGAQKDLGVTILKSLKNHIKNGTIRLNLVAGVRQDVYRFYQEAIKELNLENFYNNQVNIIFAENKMAYFAKFNAILLDTDILWTKPSELSFYAGLGLPIIIAPPVGSQEVFNKAWLKSIGAGVEQQDPNYTAEWLFDWLESGWLAQAAMSGFLNAPRNGAYHIEDIVLKGTPSEIEDIHLL
ncbi:MAG: hypothetical protein US42_C0006G0052 [Candidatus Magasanikbacteria bacterium GW2011_GWC2_37_14]|uniref:DUF6938 domain-containing protein n=1 Tax=Candidatus Magasanikbacteria bacterium GW2011_GWC2_37_14 TaxID=1619046 RepID=A0A0G0GNK4_9BACT|nr:MAG: hypothetical protein US42_C0006G0052 [Candidatus Magasanikbacteria bacterium GW2011_GWC2_37_14]